MIGFVYYLTVFVFIEDWLGLSTSLGFLNYLIFTWVAFMSLLSFFVAIIADPGGVPASFALDSENPSKNGVTSRYCAKCSTCKPPRSHHCRVCKRCVLKMDHHCIWISNCVGYGNYKPFIIFVLHAAAGSIYSTVILLSSILQKDLSRTSHELFYAFCGLLMIGFSLTLGSLLGWHIYLLTHNMTTIEYREAVRAMWLARKSGQKYRHHFDLGVCKNLSLVFGPNMLTWLCPIALGHLKDGTEFPTSND